MQTVHVWLSKKPKKVFEQGYILLFVGQQEVRAAWQTLHSVTLQKQRA